MKQGQLRYKKPGDEKFFLGRNVVDDGRQLWNNERGRRIQGAYVPHIADGAYYKQWKSLSMDVALPDPTLCLQAQVASAISADGLQATIPCIYPLLFHKYCQI